MFTNQKITDVTPADDAYQFTTIGAYVDGKPVAIHVLRSIFETVQDQADWRNAIKVTVPKRLASLVVEAIKFFHADDPHVQYGADIHVGEYAVIRGRGYQAW